MNDKQSLSTNFRDWHELTNAYIFLNVSKPRHALSNTHHIANIKFVFCDEVDCVLTMLSVLRRFPHMTLLTSASVGTEFLALGNVGTGLGGDSAGSIGSVSRAQALLPLDGRRDGPPDSPTRRS